MHNERNKTKVALFVTAVNAKPEKWFKQIPELCLKS